MDEDGASSESERQRITVGIAAGLVGASSFLRAVAESLGILDAKPLDEKKPEGAGFWKRMRNAPKNLIGKIDRLALIEPNEKGRGRTRAVFAAAIITPILVAIAVLGFHVSEARRAPESRPQEKTAPAPKPSGRMVLANDKSYRMAFGAQKNTLMLAQAPAGKRKPPVAGRTGS